MQVAVACRDPALAASVDAVVAAAAGTVLPISALPELFGVWRTAAAVVCDADAAKEWSAVPLAAGPALVLVASPHEAGEAWRLAGELRASAVVALPDGEQLLLDARLAVGRQRRERAGVVAVAGCGGGAGASSLAVVLAAEAARAGREVTLIDLDMHAGGLELLVGVERAPGLRWPDLVETPDLIGDGLPRRLPQADEVKVLSWDRRSPPDQVDPGLLAAVLAVVSGTDFVVLDLPRSALSPALLAGCDEALLVCSRQVRAVAAATLLADRCDGLPGRIRLIAGGAGPAELSTGDLQSVVGIPVAVTLPREARLARHAGVGRLHRLPSRSPTRRGCQRLLTSLSSPGRAA